MKKKYPKQAVVLIHGVGEQVPMRTLAGFVNAVWTTDPSLRRPGVPGEPWSKPDFASKNYELRRLTTSENVNGKRTDFFEFYWADLMEDTTLTHVGAWIRVLLFRSPMRLPQQVRGIWFLLVATLVAVATIYVARAFGWIQLSPGVTALASFAVALVWLGASYFLVRVAGDAARYLHVAPSNIASRRNIREAGIELLQRLHDDGSYDRIVIVGHSLGTIIGYDILTHLWPRFHEGHAAQAPTTPSPALQAAEALAREKPPQTGFVDRFQAAQAAYLDEIQARRNKWLVTDFVTMGSPLAHAPVLLATDANELERKKVGREFPACPPELERVEKEERFSYRKDKGWVPNHAAVFGVTRWTNLYFPEWGTFWGDVIGGPVAEHFGPGVRDVDVEADLRRAFFSHTRYWEPGDDPAKPPAHIAELRKALRLA